MNAQLRRNLDFFGDWASAEQEHLRFAASRNELIERVLLELNPRNGVLADIGCFTGAATVRFKALGFRHAVGFDASEAALHKAAQRVETRRWCIGEERCPADDNEFDVVIASEIIEHLMDTDEFLEELRRILPGGGRLIVTTPNLAFWVSRLRLLQGRVPWNYPGASTTTKLDNAVDLNHIRISTLSEWEGLFRAHGFAVKGVRGCSSLPAFCRGGRPLLRFIDRWMTRFPSLAFGLLFVLEKA
jgi:SAM-dependent methyltransferase